MPMNKKVTEFIQELNTMGGRNNEALLVCNQCGAEWNKSGEGDICSACLKDSEPILQSIYMQFYEFQGLTSMPAGKVGYAKFIKVGEI